MNLTCHFCKGTSRIGGVIPARYAVLGGWTGRDRKAVEAHIQELKSLGVPAPSATPLFYRVSAERLTTAGQIQALGENSSGEVEFVLAAVDGELWVGAGSDHTDREVERYGVAVSKQMCDKPVAPEFWPYTEVEPHWDRLVLRAYSEIAGKRQLYQEGPVSALMHPRDLLAAYCGGRLADGTVVFGGTLSSIGGIRPAEAFNFELEDPVLGRSIRHGYRIEVLPLVA
jgi:hypothetical protein